MDIAAVAALAPVIPVLTIEKATDAVPLARALVKGGLPVLEITLRTRAAIDALKAITADVPDAVVGAGTVMNETQLDQALRAGARFGVSPGCAPALTSAIEKSGMPFLPGVQTVSEALALAERGFRLLKFFPADTAGGTAWLKAIAAPLPEIQFCPTGGINQENTPNYLSLPNVVCIGGSWVAPRTAVAAGRWAEIEKLAADATRLKRKPASP